MPEIPKKLFAQIVDFSKLKGVKMSPEQTNLALERLKKSSFSPSGYLKRSDLVDELKSTGLLENPDVERVYAIGSAVTPKPNPTDLDILYRGKTVQATGRVSDSMDAKLLSGPLENTLFENEGVHEIVPRMVETIKKGEKYGEAKLMSKKAFDESSFKEASYLAKEGVERYGQDHKWIRLVAIPSAIGLGLMLPGDRDVAEASFVSSIKTLLNKPVSRRGFFGRAAEGVVDANKMLNLKVNPDLKSAARQDKYNEILSYIDYKVDPSDYRMGLGLDDLASMVMDTDQPPQMLAKELSNLGLKDKRDNLRLLALLEEGDITTAENFYIRKVIKEANISKYELLKYHRELRGNFLPYSDTGMYKASPEDIAQSNKNLKIGLSKVGVSFDKYGSPKHDEDLINHLSEVADGFIEVSDRLKEVAKEAGIEIGTQLAKNLSEKQVTRRGLFGLGKKPLIGAGALAASQLGGEKESEAAFKPAAVSRVATELLKYNKSGVPGTGLVQGETPRVIGILENMLKIPQTEYSRVGKVTAKPFPDIMDQATVRGRFYGKTFDINLNPRKAVPETFPHEITHARQKSFPGVDNYLEDLAEKIKKWIEDPWEEYYSRPNEVQARAMGDVVNKSPTELVPSLYDHVYNQELIKAITFTEKFLADKDPTFKGKFIKGTAIGGAVMTLLNLGPAENEASAMPRGVYEATEKIAGKLSSTAKDLIGKTLEEGKIVKDVRKGEGVNRTIYFQDGTHSTVTTKDLTSLERHFGTQKYKEIFQAKDEPAQLTQALKSMNMHEAMAKHLPPDTGAHKDLLKGYVDQYLSDLQEMGKTLSPDIVFVQRTSPEGDLLYTLPRVYAELLEEQGILSIVKSKKYIDIINQNKVK